MYKAHWSFWVIMMTLILLSNFVTLFWWLGIPHHNHEHNHDLGISDEIELDGIATRQGDIGFGVWNTPREVVDQQCGHIVTVTPTPTPRFTDEGLWVFKFTMEDGTSVWLMPRPVVDRIIIRGFANNGRDVIITRNNAPGEWYRPYYTPNTSTPKPTAIPTLTITPTPTKTPNLAKGKMIRVYPYCSVGDIGSFHTMEGRGEIVNGKYRDTWGEFHMAGPAKGCQKMVYATFTPINGPTPLHRNILDIDLDSELTFGDATASGNTIKDYIDAEIPIPIPIPTKTPSWYKLYQEGYHFHSMPAIPWGSGEWTSSNPNVTRRPTKTQAQTGFRDGDTYKGIVWRENKGWQWIVPPTPCSDKCGNLKYFPTPTPTFTPQEIDQ